MKTSYPDVFQSLDGVRAFNITLERDKMRQLKDLDVIDASFKDQDHIFFEIESINFWLRIKFLLHQRKNLIPSNSDYDDENSYEKLVIEGYTRMRVNKAETVKYLRKLL